MSEANEKTISSENEKKVELATAANQLQVRIDCDNLSAMSLMRKYRSTYYSWKNLKSRGNREGAIVAPEFIKFSDFLRYMGPRPSQQHTVDRLDNNNPEYGPSLCAWRDKHAQNRNRSNVITLQSAQGERHPIAYWAKVSKTKPSTIKKMLKEGRSEAEIIHELTSRQDAMSALPWPKDKALLWEAVYQKEQKGRNKDQSREDFLFEFANKKVKHYQALVDNCVDPHPEAALSNKEQSYLDEFQRWRGIFNHASLLRRQREKVRSEKRWLSRTSGLGKNVEVELSRKVREFQCGSRAWRSD